MPKRQAWAGRETDRDDHRRPSYQGNLEEHRMRPLHQYHFRMSESQIHHHLGQAVMIVSILVIDLFGDSFLTSSLIAKRRLLAVGRQR